MKIHAARYVLPVSSSPIENGAVAVDGKHIADVGEVGEIRGRYEDAIFEDHGDAVIIPGLVNCHSHLEITSMRGALDDVEHDFAAWLLKLTDLRREMSDADIRAAALLGAAEGARAGVTCFGDIGRYGEAGLSALTKTGLRGVVFQETEFSPADETADEDLSKLLSKYDKLRQGSTGLVEVGISPHSPYTVSSRLFQKITEVALRDGIKLTIHAAESAQEDELLVNGTGFFRDLFDKYNVNWTAPGSTAIPYLERLGVLGARPLLAHCVTVSAADIKTIKEHSAAIAHCPKSNAKFGHGYAPFEAFLDADISTGLGSDSVASNNLCDLFEEARYAALAARNRPGSSRFISAREMLRAATLGGAAALGLEKEIGSLEVGKAADMAVVSLGSIRQAPVHDVHTALIFASCATDVILTMVAGTEVYRPAGSEKIKA